MQPVCFATCRRVPAPSLTMRTGAAAATSGANGDGAPRMTKPSRSTKPPLLMLRTGHTSPKSSTVAFSSSTSTLGCLTSTGPRPGSEDILIRRPLVTWAVQSLCPLVSSMSPARQQQRRGE